ncbi:MAG TPA: cytochrome c [Aggregatilineaceae bacterium]|nr:cytochrome c [Aggregatilineaceae bacterium]
MGGLVVLIFAGILAVAMLSSQAPGASASPTSQQQVLAAYQTKCSLGTAGAKAAGYVGLYAVYGTSTVTPSRTPRPLYVAPSQTPTPSQTIDAAINLIFQDTYTPTATPTSYTLMLGNIEDGKTVFDGKAGCSTCHDTSAENLPLVGPSLAHVALVGAVRVPELSLERYLYESIEYPDAYVAPGYSAGVMPRNYQQKLSNQELIDVVDYLMTLK